MDHLSQGIAITIFATIFLLVVAVCIVTLIFSQQKKQIQNKVQAQEEVLKRVSQEIHDNIGQVLTLAKLKLNGLEFYPTNEWKEITDDATLLIGNAIQDLRSLSKVLNSDFVSSQELIALIETEIRTLKKTISTVIQFNVVGQPYKLSPHAELRVFRIFQEIISNILKHANATVITIWLSYSSEGFVMEVTDNGHGFETEMRNGSPAGSYGLGLRNMRDRAEEIGAHFILVSGLGKGTTVKIKLPSKVR